MTTDADLSRLTEATLIAKQNDRFRRGICSNPPGLPQSGAGALRGRVLFTRAVAARGLLFTLQCLAAITAHNTFEPENDPDGWHDFGCVRVEGERVWWKIDLFADEAMEWGAERPDVPAETYRVLTILFPSDW